MKVISPAAIAASPLIRAAAFAQTFRWWAQHQSRFHHNVCKTISTSYSGDATLWIRHCLRRCAAKTNRLQM